MVRIKQHIVTRGSGVEFKFADEAGFDERMQGVVDGGTGGTGAAFVQRGPELVNGGMVGMAQEVAEERDSLWRAAQAGGAQRFADVAGC